MGCSASSSPPLSQCETTPVKTDHDQDKQQLQTKDQTEGSKHKTSSKKSCGGRCRSSDSKSRNSGTDLTRKALSEPVTSGNKRGKKDHISKKGKLFFRNSRVQKICCKESVPIKATEIPAKDTELSVTQNSSPVKKIEQDNSAEGASLGEISNKSFIETLTPLIDSSDKDGGHGLITSSSSVQAPENDKLSLTPVESLPPGFSQTEGGSKTNIEQESASVTQTVNDIIAQDDTPGVTDADENIKENADDIACLDNEKSITKTDSTDLTPLPNEMLTNKQEIESLEGNDVVQHTASSAGKQSCTIAAFQRRGNRSSLQQQSSIKASAQNTQPHRTAQLTSNDEKIQFVFKAVKSQEGPDDTAQDRSNIVVQTDVIYVSHDPKKPNKKLLIKMRKMQSTTSSSSTRLSKWQRMSERRPERGHKSVNSGQRHVQECRAVHSGDDEPMSELSHVEKYASWWVLSKVVTGGLTLVLAQWVYGEVGALELYTIWLKC